MVGGLLDVPRVRMPKSRSQAVRAPIPWRTGRSRKNSRRAKEGRHGQRHRENEEKNVESGHNLWFIRTLFISL